MQAHNHPYVTHELLHVSVYDSRYVRSGYGENAKLLSYRKHSSRMRTTRFFSFGEGMYQGSRVGYTHPPPKRNMGPEIPYSWKGHGMRDQEGTWHKSYPTHPAPNRMTDRCLWQHYLPKTSGTKCLDTVGSNANIVLTIECAVFLW